jgi:acyl-CoA thioester hydrolase
MTTSQFDETSLRVRYAETDAMGIVHHSQYVIWFEVGRSSFIRQTGRSYADMEQAGYFLRIAEVGVRYHAPALYDELIVVRTRLSQLQSRGLTFSYQVVRPAKADGSCPEQLLVGGFTKLICTDRQGQVRRFPESFRTILEPLLAPEG